MWLFSLTPPARWFVSPDILDEYQRVLARPQLRLLPERTAELLALVQSRCHLVRPRRRLSVSPDPDDNIFLECAEEARADYLVTGNTRHFPRFWKTTTVIRAPIRPYHPYVE